MKGQREEGTKEVRKEEPVIQVENRRAVSWKSREASVSRRRGWSTVLIAADRASNGRPGCGIWQHGGYCSHCSVWLRWSSEAKI